MKVLKAVFESASAWYEHFNNAHCVVPISVGQTYHENIKLSLYLKLISDHFEQCSIIICDSLQRHTLKFYNKNLSDNETYQLSKKNGQEWLARNFQFIEKSLNIPYQIYHWDEWLFNSEYTENRKKLETFFIEDYEFNQIFNQTIEIFTTRLLNRNNFHWYEKPEIYQACFNYVMEECSVMPLWMLLNAQFEIYPGKRIPAMIETHKRLVSIKSPLLLRWVRVNFREKNDKITHSIETEIKLSQKNFAMSI